MPDIVRFSARLDSATHTLLQRIADARGVSMNAMLESVARDAEQLFGHDTRYTLNARTIDAQRRQRKD